MTSLKAFLLPLALFAAPLAVHAQEWREVSRGDDRAARAVYWDGDCRVEQRVDRDGYLVERRRCRGDRAAYSRASRDYADDPEPVRYAGDRAPRRYSNNRDVRPYEDAPAPLPVEPDEEAVVVAVAPRIAPKVEPVLRAPKLLAKAAPVVTAPRYVAKPAPAVKVQRVIAKAAPVPKPARVIARIAAPPAHAPRLVAKARPAVKAAVTKPPRVTAKAQPVAVAPRVIAKTEPASATPKVVAKAEPAQKTSRVFVNSDWLVILEPEPVKPVVKAAPVVKARAGGSDRLRQFEAYVTSKRSDPYSNLR